MQTLPRQGQLEWMPRVYSSRTKIATELAFRFLANLACLLFAMLQALLVCCQHSTTLMKLARREWISEKLGPAVLYAISTGIPALSEAALKTLTEHAKVLVPLMTNTQMAEEAIPGVCKLVVHSQHLSVRVHALKCIGEMLPLLDEAAVVKMILPTLRVAREKDHTPAVIMCTLGCYDIVAKRLQPSSLARHVLPGLVPLLDEKSLNAKQFEMVATRVETILHDVVASRRAEVWNMQQGSLSLTEAGAAMTVTPHSSSPSPTIASPRGATPISMPTAGPLLHFAELKTQCADAISSSATEIRLVGAASPVQQSIFSCADDALSAASGGGAGSAGQGRAKRGSTDGLKQHIFEAQRQTEMLQGDATSPAFQQSMPPGVDGTSSFSCLSAVGSAEAGKNSAGKSSIGLQQHMLETQRQIDMLQGNASSLPVHQSMVAAGFGGIVSSSGIRGGAVVDSSSGGSNNNSLQRQMLDTQRQIEMLQRGSALPDRPEKGSIDPFSGL
jgi:hypothetical protein